MSDVVVFEHDSLDSYDWDSEQKAKVKVPFRLSDLRCRVKISPGVTLGEIFKSVDRHPELKQVIAAYAWCGSIDEFHAEALKPRPEEQAEESKDRIVKLIVKQYAQLSDENEHKDFNIITEFCGSGPNKERWSVSCTPMNELAHLPVEIDETFTIERNWKEEILSIQKSLNLLEFLDAIYWDISFHGSPEDNARFVEELQQQIKEIDNGTAKLIPFEEVMKDFETEHKL